MTTETKHFSDLAFDLLTEDSGAPARDITETARARESGNFLRHAGALSLSKLADGLIDPKLVLSWLMGTLGAPAALIGLLVPVRESGALLPQLLTAPRIRAMGRRKWAWAGGALGQGLAALAILLAALMLSGWAAGLVIVAALAVLAVSRSVCSVSYKDVLGKTVDKSRRGTVTGLAGSIAAAGVLIFAGLLISGTVPRLDLVLGAIALAGLCWIGSASIFATMTEEDRPGETATGIGLSQIGLLWRDPRLGHFVMARILLLPTALAPPYLVMLADQAGEDRLGALGAMVLASSLAGLTSSWVWGRLADRSSRLVLAIAGAVAAAFLGLAVMLDTGGLMGTVWAAPAVLFGLMIAYQGVRLGRSTYLVDMAPSDNRAVYTAVANTTVGVALIAAGGFGIVAALIGPALTLAAFAGISACGALLSFTMKEA
ncbi:Permease of the major facilitator superfamily [Rhodovulum sp. P5]|uniref:MFS transporter n=1 Tax=Rhodovulum sp. P5 TaxID=1564506 RepID=UPI0009C1C1C6|nr:MFS transporter [Rhodovulum sp. P5]ARE39314.1 Permease of the major facilitator superfamily [Rhodovulum sp. P5]